MNVLIQNIFLFFQKDIRTINNLYQLFSIFAVFVVAYTISFFERKIPATKFLTPVRSSKLKSILDHLTFPVVWVILQWTLVAASREFDWDWKISYALAKFISAWLATRVFSIFVTKDGLKKVANVAIYLFTVLDILGLLPQLIVMTDNFGLQIGGLHVSLLSFIKGCLLFYFLIWATVKASKWAESQIRRAGIIEPSLQELFSKLIRVSFIAFSVLITLSTVGLDLSAFAVFSGAIGVGIGFGLQKVFSNLLCGIILLVDRTIKPGDVIALNNGTTYGVINRLGARCVTARTRCGKEHLIPNEDFIVHKSENWTFTDRLHRLSIPMPAAFESDVDLVMKLLLDACVGVKRVLLNPPPGARLRSLGENELNFEVRVWINDPQNGLSKVKSDIYVNILKLFKENDVIIPYPRRDLFLSEPVSEMMTPSFEKYATGKLPETE